MESSSLFNKIWEQRVLQVVGLYIAATWMAIEIGDWVIERFVLAPEITSFIFIAMLCFLPSVVLLAFQYGKKGKDPWHKSTFLFVPANGVLAVFLSFTFVQPVKATEVKTAIDETGKTQEYVVPKEQYNRRIISFFWEEEQLADDEKWLQYALPWLLGKDLSRNKFLSNITPFEHAHLYNIVKDGGFEKGVGEPLALQLDAVRKHSREYFITGKVTKQNDFLILTAHLYRSSDGKIEETFTAKGKNIFKTIDQLSEEISKNLIGFAIRESVQDDLPVKEHVISDHDALRVLTNAMVDKLKNPYGEQYIGQFEEAYSLEPTSIEILKILSAAYFNNGQFALAKQIGDKLQKQFYKLTRQEKFKYQGYLYSINGDYDSHLKILDLWVELYPNSIDAHNYRAQYQLSYAKDLNTAEASMLKLTSLLPNDAGVFYRLASLYDRMGKIDKSIDVMRKSIELSSDKVNGNLQLAQLYEQKGDFASARDIYEEVALIEPDKSSVKYLLALNQLKLGDLKQAEKILTKELKANNLSINEIAGMRHLLGEVYVSSGEIDKAQQQYDLLESELANLSEVNKLNATIIPKIHLLEKLGEHSQQVRQIENTLVNFEPPYTYVIESLLLGVYRAQKDINAINEFIKRYELISEENSAYVESILDYAYLYFYELTDNYIEAKNRSEVIIERLKKTSRSIKHRFSYLSWKVESARLYYLTEQYDRSEAILSEVLVEFPASVLAKKELVTLYLKTNRLEKAKQLDAEIMTIWANANPEYVEYQDYLELRAKLDLEDSAL
ncbi:tetratricopeptide repeat protein [Pleionea sediminis]|uniref:tetratricopeptide repeat protein n=1 Tax=Pleionea sediminis TaxID=2569479 RepID=UPI0011848988|nr:tetratricopeptide repeat protein [Pleionea sediminis]